MEQPDETKLTTLKFCIKDFRYILEDELSENQLAEQLADIEYNRSDIIDKQKTYKESYTKEDLFDKCWQTQKLNKRVMSHWKRISCRLIIFTLIFGVIAFS